MVVRLNRETSQDLGATYQSCHWKIALAIVARKPEGVVVELDRGGTVETALWLRAHVDAHFPMVLSSRGRASAFRREGIDTLVSAGGPDRFVCGPPQDAAQHLAHDFAGDWSEAQTRVASALIAIYERGFRHDFGNRVAAVRLILGAVRAGAVPLDEGRQIIAALAGHLPRVNQGPLELLLEWYTRGLAVLGQRAPAVPMYPVHRSILLIDDEATSAGWDSVLGAILGPDFRAVTTAAEGIALARRQPLDGVLVDLDLAQGEDGFQVIAELRARQFDLPLIAFTVHDRAEFALEALRLGADAYFTKEVADKADRDSEDYFRRFHRLVRGMPRYADPLRAAWRDFSAVEAPLESFESQRHAEGDFFGSLRAGDWFRMAYFFATATRLDSDGAELADVRYHTYFRAPEMAAQVGLHLAAKLLTNRWLRRRDEHAELWKDLKCLKEGERVELPSGDWTALNKLADQRRRHGAVAATEGVEKRWFQAVARLMGKAAGPPAAAGLSPAAFSIVRRPRLADGHAETRQAAFEALRKGVRGVTPLASALPAIIVDDDPAPWQELLPRFGVPGTHVVAAQAAAEEILGQVEATLAQVGGAPLPLLLLDLDWRGDGGRAALTVLDRLKRRYPWLPVLVASALDSSLALHRTLYRGAYGYFLLRPSPEDPDGYAVILRRQLQRAATLAAGAHPVQAVWQWIADIEPLIQRRFPDLADACLGMLRLAVFCYHADYNPAESWRHRRLLQAYPGEGSAMLLRSFFMLAVRPVEAMQEALSFPRTDRDVAFLFNLRTTAMKFPDDRSLALHEPGRVMKLVVEKIRDLCEKQ